jgi:hypothetical protein
MNSQLYKNATLYFSQDNASIAAVIPAMDCLSSSLDPTTKQRYHPAIVAAMKLAQKKMDRYYSLTDSSAIYRIAMVLHPGMKLKYFKQREWEEEWVEQAENMVCEEFISVYEKDKDKKGKDVSVNKTADNTMVRCPHQSLGLCVLMVC